MKYKKRPKSIFLLAILCIFPLASFGKPHAPVNFVLGDTLPKQNTVALETILNINNIFSYQNINKEFPVPSTIKNDRAQAETVLKEIENKNAWVNIISSATIVSLPVGIKSRVNDVEYAIGIAKATIQKDYTELTVFVRAVLPQTDERGIPLEIFFAANTIKLSHDGGLFGNGNLVLLGDVQIPFNAGNWLLELKGGLDYKKGVTENLSYVTIDCSGVKEMGLTAEVQFSRNLILPVTKKGKLLPETKTVKRLDNTTEKLPNRVTGKFSIVASGWNDIITSIDLQPFVLAKHPNKFVFNLSKAELDFSDLRTPDIAFPQHYHDKGLLLPNANTWRGVYVKSLEVSLPKTFKTTESIAKQDRVSFGAKNMIIDNNGVSGVFSAKDIISIESGRTNDKKAWAYSVDHIVLEITTNRITNASFDGRILLPISESKETTKKTSKKTAKDKSKNKGISYKGLISEEEYLVRVTTIEALNIDVWQAKAQLQPDSFIEMKVVDDRFMPKAVLHGRMAISASQKKSLEKKRATTKKSSAVDFKGIEFQNLVLQTEGPKADTSFRAQG
ncbi:hypothetical protein [Cellulophaga sp. Ld12]|uniref:hypothetical protein n=1 Tax=Cellulophaga sp. Ld12 TaxID=3229535 RepID=UPI00386796FD